ncbi:MAG: hypothetical protein JO154_15455 [Chitinophaga sp.]|uniref:hypothetical protein n=1 Tax=Chitinophaga sp. TaxID=1869181 RepID=UPI0025BB0CCC|nr:hypothetical protein [Chitinophaga sp.]MBV8253998.1 hypothetical protein [Chitinophaga sp.]
MKRTCYWLTAILFLSSCITDPPPGPSFQRILYNETACNDPWGKAVNTTPTLVDKWLQDKGIHTAYNTELEGSTADSLLQSPDCSKQTGRRYVLAIYSTDVQKAIDAGVKPTK